MLAHDLGRGQRDFAITQLIISFAARAALERQLELGGFERRLELVSVALMHGAGAGLARHAAVMQGEHAKHRGHGGGTHHGERDRCEQAAGGEPASERFAHAYFHQPAKREPGQESDH